MKQQKTPTARLQGNMEIIISVSPEILYMREEFVVPQLQGLVLNAFRDMQHEYFQKEGLPTASVHLALTKEAVIPPEKWTRRMGDVVSLDDHRPHITVLIEDGSEARVVVAPITMFENMATGVLPITEVDGWESLVRVIISEWLDGLDVRMDSDEGEE